MAASLTDWLSAVGSLVAAAGALGALVIGVVLLRPQLSDFRSRRSEAEQAQAATITAWSERLAPEGRWLVAHNGSDSPVFDVRLWLITGDPPEHEDAPPQRAPSAARAVLTPHDELRYLIDANRLKPPPATRPPVEVAFRDIAGREWWRDAMGRLKKLS